MKSWSEQFRQRVIARREALTAPYRDHVATIYGVPVDTPEGRQLLQEFRRKNS